MDRDYFKGKTVLVMGLGRFGGGVDSAVFAHRAGAKVIVTDLADETALAGPLGQLREFGGIEYHLGEHREADFGAAGPADIVIANPAVASDNRFLEIARKAGKVITSQIEILFQLSPAPIVGITGSNGKSTTTALTAHLLEAGAGKRDGGYNKVYLGGNIGNRQLLGRIAEIGPSDIVALELSSFQLEQLERIGKGPSVAVVTNVTPNHLDRHGTFEAYCRAKENIFRFQELNGDSEAVSIFNAEDAVAMEWFNRYRGQSGRHCITFSADDVPDEVRGVFRLRGRFNLSNLSAAIAVALRFGVSIGQIKETLGSFTGLDHRLQLIAEIGGVSWYNDSIATTPASTIAALEAFDQPKILIAGGYDKGLAFDELGRCIGRRARAVVLIGA
ncbi:MAG: UDP-N-acetylmuramoyl-L-alanine--D-glutamate ligase, partial [Planctomycetes bacterium]|nr:UDP-N-acetylmuramoyl-L-alanine--D-glutamate ligase [Planctomycetota bacterium]